MAEHLSADDLAELALWPSSGSHAWQRRHLRVCVKCTRGLQQLRKVVESARSATTDDILVAPPPGVWHTISAELGLPATDARSGQAGGNAPAGHDLFGADGPSTDTAPGQPCRRVRRRGSGLLLATAALITGLLTGSAASGWHLHEDESPVVVGRTAPLAPLAAGAAEGTVQIHQEADARRAVTVSVSGLPPTRGYYEVWLMDRSHTKLIAVGVLGPDGKASLPLPDGVDLAAYPLIDVSAQVYNGDPAHSGESVVRGDLPSWTT
ncbi:anti-sigma factor [Streptomyces sp. NPDC090301]|uniref:anti-sigma factor n=1 Tax=Streptomyces sp. NPDC090301 TaxID=3154975 RepID=UPI003422EC05